VRIMSPLPSGATCSSAWRWLTSESVATPAPSVAGETQPAAGRSPPYDQPRTVCRGRPTGGPQILWPE
jgi:hypothetical protein